MYRIEIVLHKNHTIHPLPIRTWWKRLQQILWEFLCLFISVSDVGSSPVVHNLWWPWTVVGLWLAMWLLSVLTHQRLCVRWRSTALWRIHKTNSLSGPHPMVNSLCSFTRSLQCKIPTGNRRVITFADDTVIYIIILLRQWFFFIKLTAKANELIRM